MTVNRPSAPDVDLPVLDVEGQQHEAAIALYFRMLLNIFLKLYSFGRAREFWAHYQLYLRHLMGFRLALKNRGWKVPAGEQERFVAAVVTRCAKALESKQDRGFVPGYFRKALVRAVAYYAEELNQHKLALTDSQAREIWHRLVRREES